MQKISTSTFTVLDAPGIGDENGIRLLAKAGFEALDYGFFYLSEDPRFRMSDEAHTKYYKNLRAIADDCGIEIHQAHSPMPNYLYTGDEPLDNIYMRLQIKAMKAASILGATYIVIHPVILKEDRRTPERGEPLREKCQEINYKYYSRLKPFCEEYGIKIAVENMFNWDPDAQKICPTVCSTAAEMKAYVDMMGRDWFVNCLDIGHAVLTGSKPQDMIRELGDYIGCLHVHDNDGIHDLHQAPHTGIIEWKEVMQALREIGYHGVFNMEADMFFYGYGTRLFPETTRLLYRIGQDLVEFEGK